MTFPLNHIHLTTFLGLINLITKFEIKEMHRSLAKQDKLIKSKFEIIF